MIFWYVADLEIIMVVLKNFFVFSIYSEFFDAVYTLFL